MRPRGTAIAVLAAGTLLLGTAACSGGDGGGGDDRPSAGRSGSASGAAPSGFPELPEASRFTVPKGFDNAHGWTEAVSEPDSRTHGSWAVAPSAGVFVQVMNAEGKVHARAVGGGGGGGGKDLWTFTAPTKLESARTDVHVAANPGDEEFAVVVRAGRTPAEGLERPRPLVTVDTVPMSSTGKAKAVQHVEYEDAEAGPFAGRLLVTGKTGSDLRALDPFTGEDRQIDQLGEVRLSGCRKADLPPGAECSADTSAEFVTEAGAVATYTQDGYCDYRWKAKGWVPCGEGFTVGTAWRSEQAAPDGAADATPLAVVGKYLVVAWSAFRDAASEKAAEQDVVAVHTLADGKLVAEVDCDITGPSTGRGSVSPLAAQHTSQLSPNGEYLVSGQVGFDLSAKSGSCFADTAKKRGVTLTAVSDTGRAYGVSYSESTWADVRYGTFPHDFGSSRVSVPGRAVAADVRTGSAQPLRKGTALPVHVGGGAGLFLNAGTLAAYPSVPG